MYSQPRKNPNEKLDLDFYRACFNEAYYLALVIN